MPSAEFQIFLVSSACSALNNQNSNRSPSRTFRGPVSRVLVIRIGGKYHLEAITATAATTRTRMTTCQISIMNVTPCTRAYGASGRTVRTTRNPW